MNTSQKAVRQDMVHPHLIREIKQEAIKDFVDKLSGHYKKLSGEAITELHAVAIGYFGLTFADFYENVEVTDHSDFTLAEVERQKHQRAVDFIRGAYPEEYCNTNEFNDLSELKRNRK